MRGGREVWRAEDVPLELLDEAVKGLLCHLPVTGVIAMEGGMGMGKTTWVRAICRAWGIEAGVASPTFGLVHVYHTPAGRTLHHLDLYRVRNEEEAWDMGLETYFDAPVLNWVEWPDRAGSLLPEDAWFMRLEASTAGVDCRTVSLWAPA
jgi:tRNA threonylcarbamoyladenosine biosynthesis protein TsaE